jgi:hypothetical protein
VEAHNIHLTGTRASIMKIRVVGIDLAKNVFQIHGVDERGKAVLKKQLKRHQVLAFFANLSTCLVGIEACGGAHFWGRRLQAQGHTVRLMAPQFVKPCVKGNKHDAADAERCWSRATLVTWYPNRSATIICASTRRCEVNGMAPPCPTGNRLST